MAPPGMAPRLERGADRARHRIPPGQKSARRTLRDAARGPGRARAGRAPGGRRDPLRLHPPARDLARRPPNRLRRPERGWTASLRAGPRRSGNGETRRGHRGSHHALLLAGRRQPRVPAPGHQRRPARRRRAKNPGGRFDHRRQRGVARGRLDRLQRRHRRRQPGSRGRRLAAGAARAGGGRGALLRAVSAGERASPAPGLAEGQRRVDGRRHLGGIGREDRALRGRSRAAVRLQRPPARRARGSAPGNDARREDARGGTAGPRAPRPLDRRVREASATSPSPTPARWSI